MGRETFNHDEDGDGFADLVSASQSSLGFWDHPWDDRDWNNPLSFPLTTPASAPAPDSPTRNTGWR